MSTNSFFCLSKRTLNYITCFGTQNLAKPLWRNGLACWTSNSKVVGSSPTRGGFFFSFFFFLLTVIIFKLKVDLQMCDLFFNDLKSENLEKYGFHENSAY